MEELESILNEKKSNIDNFIYKRYNIKLENISNLLCVYEINKKYVYEINKKMYLVFKSYKKYLKDHLENIVLYIFTIISARVLFSHYTKCPPIFFCIFENAMQVFLRLLPI